MNDITHKKNLGTFTSIRVHPETRKNIYNVMCKNYVDKKKYKIFNDTDITIKNFFSKLYNISQKNIQITSGSTESILMSLYYAKEEANAKGIKKPNIIVPIYRHHSFDNCCRIVGLDMKITNVKEDLSLDFDELRSQIDENTIMLVAIAGSTELGIVDDLHKFDQIATENNIGLHVDCAIGGMLLPFLIDGRNPFGYRSTVSINISGHKYGLSLPGCGILITKKEYQKNKLNYLSSGEGFLDGLLVTKSGLGPFSLATNIKNLGFDGFKRIAKQYIRNYNLLKNVLLSNHISFYCGSEYIPLIFVDDEKSEEISKQLTESGRIQSIYKPSYYKSKGFRIVIKKGRTKKILNNILRDILKSKSNNVLLYEPNSDTSNNFQICSYNKKNLISTNILSKIR